MPVEKDRDGYFLYQDVTVLRGCRLLSVHTRRVQRKAEARLLNIQMHPAVCSH